jgi:integrase
VRTSLSRVRFYLLDPEHLSILSWEAAATATSAHSAARPRRGPCGALTALLHAHIQEFGVQPDGRLFVGERNDGEPPTMTIGRVWRRARQAAFIPEVAASPLARTPYDLRHAAVSTWLNGGVPPTTVAEWAGHSVEVLLRIYAKCLDGGDALVRRRVEAALGYVESNNATDAGT